MKFILVVLALAGGYYYVSRHFEFNDTLVYAKKHPESRYAPAIDYYVGTIYYQRENYGKAQEAFTQLLTDFPTTQYAPTALERLSDAAEYNGDWQTAKDSLQRYVEEYPNGKDMQVVQKRLELLKYHHP